jgi:hypothetical protein
MPTEFSGLFAERFRPFLGDVIPRFQFDVVSVTDETDCGYNVAIVENDDMRLRLMREQGAYLVYVAALHSNDWMSLALVLHTLGLTCETVRHDLAAQAEQFTKFYTTIAGELRTDRYREFYVRYRSVYKSVMGVVDPWA